MVESGEGKARSLEKLSKEAIEALPGHYDEDGFYILEEGGFYDPAGFHYDRNGVDAIGGFYDNAGVYIAPQRAAGTLTLNEDGRSVLCVKLEKAEIEAKPGSYDEDGFYMLSEPAGAYYDPLGYVFDADGFDTVGGSYDAEGYYRQPEAGVHEAAYGDDLEDYTLDEEVDGAEEDEPQLAEDDLDRQAVLHEHVMPAQLHVKQEQEQEPDKMFYVRLVNFPELYREQNILRFLSKKIPAFTHSKLLTEKDDHGEFTGSVLVQASDRATLNALLLLHDYRLQGYHLQAFLMGFEYEATTMQMMGADASNTDKFTEIFTRMAIVESHQQAAAQRRSQQAAANPEKPALAKQASETVQEDEFEVTKAVPAQKAAAQEDDDDEFQVSRM